MEIKEKLQLTPEEQVLVEKNIGLVISTIKRHYSPYLSNVNCRDDIIQCGQMGVINACFIYRDPKINTKYAFSTIASRYIKNSINNYLKSMEFIKESHNTQKFYLKNQYHFYTLTGETGDDGMAKSGEILESTIEDENSTNFEEIVDNIDRQELLSKIRQYIGEDDYNFLIEFYSSDSNKRQIHRVSKRTDYSSYYGNIKYKKTLMNKIKKQFPKYVVDFDKK